MAVLDTTVLIDLSRRPDSSFHARARIAVSRLLAADQSLFTSRINEAEFRVGPEMAGDRERELDRVERILAGVVILEFDALAAICYAVIKAAMFKRGRPVGDCDALIASICIANGQTLLTRNPKHFDGIPGLSVNSY
ncbi:MAG: type II toxin-antitoxin system VapC family toxin [Phycisphaerae bacterium]|nr:type II toxin-antitoxin system VapC family toxin [Phycisphaerae bacterium]